MYIPIGILWVETYLKVKESEGYIANMIQDGSNRQKILACAQHLFFEKGYDAVGVQEIVNTAGITKPTMYYYFKSKQGLLECLLQEGGERLLQRIGDITEQDGDFEDMLYQVTEVYVWCAVGDMEFYLMLISLFSSAKDNEAFHLAKPYISRLIQLMTAFFEKYAEEVPEMKGKEEYLAISYTGVINMYMLVYFERGELQSEKVLRTLVKETCAFFKKALT